MSETILFGQLFHTPDGKTVFIDPKTNQATIFEGITKEQIMEPQQTGMSSLLSQLLEFHSLSSIMSGVAVGDLVAQPAKTLFTLDKEEGEVDILGPKEYYILVPDGATLLSAGATISAWVSEHKNGHKPIYQGHTKHRIMAEQWDFLLTHKACMIRAWYASNVIPAYPILCCQDHNKIISPVIDTTVTMTKGNIDFQTVKTQSDNLAAEEREI